MRKKKLDKMLKILLIAIFIEMAVVIISSMFLMQSVIFKVLFYVSLISGGITLLLAMGLLDIFSENEITLDVENGVNDFEEIYQKLYNDYIKDLQKLIKCISQKKKNERNIIIFVLVSFAIIRICDMLYLFDVTWLIVFVTIIFLISSFLNRGQKFISNEKMYVEEYQQKVIPNFIKYINEKLNYIHKDEELTLQNKVHYENSKIEYAQLYESCHNIEGYIAKDTFMRFFHYKALEILDEKIKLEKSGYFAFTVFNVDIETRIEVITKQLLLSNENKIEMDSLEFENFFDLIAGNKMTAMKIFSHRIMEILKDFYEKYNVGLHIVLEGNTMYIKLLTGFSFEPNLEYEIQNKKRLYKIYCGLRLLIELSEEIKLELDEL